MSAGVVSFGAHRVGYESENSRRQRARSEAGGASPGADHLDGQLSGGACAGLAGMVEVAAIHGRASQAISAGYGYVGILVAFLARMAPLRILVVSVVLGAVLASGGILQRDHELPDATITVFEGIAFLAILASEALSGRLSFLQVRADQSAGELADAKP
jgi:ABC-type uncharacterized transport system permease subunit